MMTEEQFIALLEGFHNGRLTEMELQSFLEAADNPRFEALIGDQLQAELALMKGSALAGHARADKVWQRIEPSL